MQPPLLSIITTVLNQASTIEELIDSIRIQTFRDFEYIVIDGGSTDGTLQLLEKNMDVITVLQSGPDNGIFDAMNKGVRIAKGKLLCFLGADDYFASSDVFSKIAEHYKKNLPDMIYGNFIAKDSNGNLKRKGRKMFLFDLKAGRVLPHQAMFMDREKFIEMGLFNSEEYKIFGAEFDLICEFFRREFKSEYINLDITVYSTTGVSSTSRDALFKKYADIIENRYGKTRKNLFVIKKAIRKAMHSFFA